MFRSAAAAGLLFLVSGCALPGLEPSPPSYRNAVFADRWTATDGTTIDYFILPTRDAQDRVVLHDLLRRNGTWRTQWATESCDGAARIFLRILNHHYDLMQAREGGEDTAALREAFRRALDEDLAPCWSDREPG